jgi:Glycosyl transferase family 2
MSVRVSVVVPSRADTGALAEFWVALEPELTEADELILVDDSGTGVLEAWAEVHIPRARVLTRDQVGGYAAAVQTGAEAAAGLYLLVMDPRVWALPGLLDPLVEVLDQESDAPESDDRAATLVAPRLTSMQGCLSTRAVKLDDGHLHLVPRDPVSALDGVLPLPFAPAACFALRRAAFEGLGGSFGPFGWQDVDLGLATWRAGGRVLEVSAAGAELTGTGGLECDLPRDMARACEEKNRLLVLWKYLDTKADAHDHMASLWRDAIEAGVAGRRELLVSLVLALQELPRVDAARKKLGTGVRALEQVLRVSDPAG